MTWKFLLLAVILVLTVTTAGLGSCIPGQDISARASLSYSSLSTINAAATVAFVDCSNLPGQSASEPTTAFVETSFSPTTTNPVVSFVVPDDRAPLYMISSASLYSGLSLAGQRVKLAGKLIVRNGTAFLDDGASLHKRDGAMACGVWLRKDLLSALPRDGALAVVKAVVRVGSDNHVEVLPVADSDITIVQ